MLAKPPNYWPEPCCVLQLWHAYLTERKQEVRGLPPNHPALDALNNTYERALVSMHKMPRVWIEYCTLLMDQKFVTRARRAFDRAICALPITQHDRIWQLYLVSFSGQALWQWPWAGSPEGRRHNVAR